MSLRPSGDPGSGRSDPALISSSLLAFAFAGEAVAPRDDGVPDEEDVPDDFGRLVRIMQSNERLFESLHALSERLQVVRSYLARVGGDQSLGLTCYRHWRARHSGVLARLRANRLEARHLLARIDPEALERCPTSASAPVPPSVGEWYAPDPVSFPSRTSRPSVSLAFPGWITNRDDFSDEANDGPERHVQTPFPGRHGDPAEGEDEA